ncbi:YfhO family protein [Weissella ceti]|uniref:YfhO family protein n=1 Tax=Weissella ceti TaxID=759620 RepID=A0ABT3E3J6_9LACO|nr:YfhO family protein [Weissella ceti]MCW0952492.1 YfhO family protein [Weissella ceti]
MASLNPMRWQHKTRLLWLSFMLPAVFMTLYFAYRQMAPFGDNTILTVDLGQQYIDFFEAFRTAIIHDPSQLFFNFSKGLGGEMYGDWAYYLLSPTNIILLFFPNTYLPAGILWLTVIKYGLASLSFGYALYKLNWQRNYAVPIFGFAYSQCGWFVANQLNVIWLDAAILLPLIILGIEYLFDHRPGWFYVITLTMCIICNYYMAYMVGLFVVCYVFWRLFVYQLSWNQRFRLVRQFTAYTLIAIGVSAIVWLPTAYTLLGSKGQYMLQNLTWTFQYMPPDILAKFFGGTFNFDQMPSGLPNIFVGSIPLITFWACLITRKIRWQTKVATVIVTTFLVISMMFAPLDLMWHGFQYPVWYPYRFSFVFCFWLLWLCAATWHPNFRISLKQSVSLFIVAVVAWLWLAARYEDLNFLSLSQLTVGIVFFLLFLLCLTLPYKQIYWGVLVSILVLIEMSSSTILTLNNFSYLSNSEYQTSIKNLNTITANLPQDKQDFYRVTQSFHRTKGDPLQGHYYGGSTFSSGLEHQQSDFMATIGQPEGDNYINYTNGTLVTDSWLSMRYLMQSNGLQQSTPGTPAADQVFPRYDTNGIYDLYAANPLTLLSENPYSLPLGFMANDQLHAIQLQPNTPLLNQNTLWSAATNQKKPLFTKADFSSAISRNTSTPTQVTNASFTKKDHKKPASLELSFVATSNDPYYLTLGNSVTTDATTITLNGRELGRIPSHRHTIVLPLTAGKVGKVQTIKFDFHEDDLWLQNVALYRLNMAPFKAGIKELKQQELKLSHFSDTHITGTITATSDQRYLTTSIPNSKGWHVYVDGKPAEIEPTLDFFIGLSLTPGEHEIMFTYRPPWLIIGAIISALALSVGVTAFIFQRRNQKN